MKLIRLMKFETLLTTKKMPLNQIENKSKNSMCELFDFKSTASANSATAPIIALYLNRKTMKTPFMFKFAYQNGFNFTHLAMPSNPGNNVL